jgi:hypothetical protein
MANGKKSFILYCDQRGTFERLSNEQAGKLIKHIFAYVSDENPESDFVTELAFEAIKSSLKRDLKKYESYIEKQRENGKRGGRPKKAKKPNPLNENPSQAKKADSVSVSDSVNDILLEKETKEVFQEWLEYRKQIKKEIRSEKTLVSLAKRIQKAGAKRSRQVIEQSIENQWQGLFWDRQPEQKKEKVDFSNPDIYNE